MTGEPTVDWIIGGAALIVALGTIYRRAIRPVLRAANTVADATPTLLGMAEEFKPNGGASLRDVVNRIEFKADSASAAARTAASAAVEAVEMAQRAVEQHSVTQKKVDQIDVRVRNVEQVTVNKVTDEPSRD